MHFQHSLGHLQRPRLGEYFDVSDLTLVDTFQIEPAWPICGVV